MPDPNNFLDVDSGTNPGNTAIAKFSQNDGSITLGNGTGTVSVFSPTISGVSSGGVPWGMLIQGRQGTASNFTGVILRGVNASGGAPGINSNTLQVQNFGTTQLTINYQGVVTINNLAGTGTRMVTADSTGTLSATSEVSSGTYTPTILSSSSGTFIASEFTYTKIGNIVTVNGRIGCTLTSIGQNGIVIDLPYPITVTNTDEIRGTVSGNNVSGATASTEGAYVTALVGLNSAAINFFAVDTNAAVFTTFTYKV